MISVLTISHEDALLITVMIIDNVEILMTMQLYDEWILPTKNKIHDRQQHE